MNIQKVHIIMGNSMVSRITLNLSVSFLDLGACSSVRDILSTKFIGTDLYLTPKALN